MSVRAYPFIFFIIFGCTSSPSPSGGGKTEAPKDRPEEIKPDPKAPKENDPKTSTPSEGGLVSGPGKEKGPVLVETEISLQLFLAHSGDAKLPTSYMDVRSSFSNCLTCHSEGQRSPNLSSFPFVGIPGESLADVMNKIAKRMNDTQNPMPPRGLLDIAERQAATEWIRAGYLAVPPAPPASEEFSGYQVLLTWTIEGNQKTAKLNGGDSGAFTQSLGSLTVGSNITLSLKVVGPREVVVFEKQYSALSIPATGKLNIPVQAPVVDVLPPAPGQNGDIRSTNVTHNSINLEWTGAADAETPAQDLLYSVYQSANPNLENLEQIRSNGTALLLGQAALTQLAVKDLSPETTYYFAVIVKDSAGNEAAYKARAFTTLEDPSAPVVSEYPNCIASTQTRARVSAWRDAAAKDLAAGTDGNVVAARIRQCFGADVPACVQPSLDYARRSDIAGAESDGPVSSSPQRQPPPEFLAPNASGTEYVIPANLEQIAEANGWPFVRYKSRHAGGFDSQTPSLLMVYVPGDKVTPRVNYDRWLNFAIPADSGAAAMTPKPQARIPTEAEYTQSNNLPRVFTLVTLEKPVGGKPAEVFFQKFNRKTSGPKFTPEDNSDVTGCSTCHPNGLRAISPLGLHVRQGEPQLPEKDWRAAELINAAMITAAGGKAVSWRSTNVGGVRKPFFVPGGQGPVLGPVTPLNESGTRTKDFIMGTATSRGCYNARTTVRVVDIFGRAPGANNVYNLSNNPEIRWEKVRDAMKCASCHDNVQRGALTQLTDMSQVDFKILVDQSMPLGAHANPLDTAGGTPATPVRDDLTADERIALANCLGAEFGLERRELKKWLTQNTCQ